MPDFKYENEFRSKGYNLICGIDEAGRGPLAGPVCAAAVILAENVQIEGLNDSKKISEKKRELLFDEIKQKAVAYSIAFSTVEEIEKYNILEATYLAMNRAAEGLEIKPDFAIIDGNRVPRNFKFPCSTLVKGDALSLSCSAASILAKVTRDRYMCNLGAEYDVYNFNKHKGYGTREHVEAILTYGVSDVHRPSFLKKILEKHEK